MHGFGKKKRDFQRVGGGVNSGAAEARDSKDETQLLVTSVSNQAGPKSLQGG